MKALLLAAREVLSSGRFITVWSLLLAFFVSVTVMSASVHGVPRIVLFAASAAGWVLFAAALAGVAALERAVRGPRTRVVVIVVGVVVIATLRPLSLDVWLLIFGAYPSPLWMLPGRILTNIIVWFIVLTAVAVLVDALRSLRTTNALLASVKAEMDAAQDAQEAFDREAHATIGEATGVLREGIAELRTAADSAAAVARASDRLFRDWSHRLSALAERPIEVDVAPPTAPRRARGGGLRVPPAGIVAALYVPCMIPYVARLRDLPVAVIGLAIVLLGGAIVDAASRHPRLPRRGVVRVTVYLLLSAVVGVSLSVAVLITGIDPLLRFLPAVGYVALAAGCAACAGAVQGLQAEQRRLARAITAQHSQSRAATSSTRSALRTASEVLHRDGQGACTVFVLQHHQPTSVDVATLTDRLTLVADAVGAVFDAVPPAHDASAIDDLVATWGRAIHVQFECDPRTRAVLDSAPAVAADVFEIVAEGLLNAVKHATVAAAEVHLALVETGAGRRVLVQVHSLGEITGETRLRPDSAVGALGAVLRSTGETVVLEATVAVPNTVSARPVVSAALDPDGHIAPS